MSGLNFDFVQTAMSYWLGALSEPVLIIGRDEMARAAADGAIVWDVRPADEVERNRLEGALALGDVDWLLADNCGGNLIPPAVIEETLAGAGIQAGRAVVIYAEKRAVDAFVALRALRSIGIGDAQVCLGDAAAVEPAPGRPADAAPAPTRPAAAATAGAARPVRRAPAPRTQPLGQPA